jgi:hypothetical protein
LSSMARSKRSAACSRSWVESISVTLRRSSSCRMQKCRLDQADRGPSAARPSHRAPSCASGGENIRCCCPPERATIGAPPSREPTAARLSCTRRRPFAGWRNSPILPMRPSSLRRYGDGEAPSTALRCGT